jgi:hypothetical protein
VLQAQVSVFCYFPTILELVILLLETSVVLIERVVGRRRGGALQGPVQKATCGDAAGEARVGVLPGLLQLGRRQVDERVLPRVGGA